MRRFIILNILLFLVFSLGATESSTFADAPFQLAFGLGYIRQVSDANLEGLNKFTLNNSLFQKSHKYIAWEVYLNMHFYAIKYVGGVPDKTHYNHASLLYGVALRYYPIDFFYIKVNIGGFADMSGDTYKKVSGSMFNSGFEIAYVFPYKFLDYINPFIFFDYNRFHQDTNDLISFGLGGSFEIF